MHKQLNYARSCKKRNFCFELEISLANEYIYFSLFFYIYFYQSSQILRNKYQTRVKEKLAPRII
jgi:hypothetical protein